MAQTSVEVSPIVVLITEQDDGIFNSIIKNKDALYKMGYRHINLEFNSDLRIDQQLLQLKGAEIGINKIMRQPVKKEIDDEFAKWVSYLNGHYYTIGNATLLKAMQLDKKWGLSFIDIKKSEMFKPNSYELKASLNDLKPMREAKFADEIMKSSPKFNGGTITIIGSNHYTIYDLLLQRNPDFCKSLLFVTFQKFHPFQIPLEATKLAEFNKARMGSYQQNVANRKTALDAFFPRGSYYNLSISDSAHVDLMDKLFLRYIESKNESLKPIPVEQSISNTV